MGGEVGLTPGEHHMFLPLRRCDVQLFNASTRHGKFTGRTIDLVCHSQELCVDVIIHSGVQCRADGRCNWPECVEYARGDHFILEMLVSSVLLGDGGEAGPTCPLTWHGKLRWRIAWGHASQVLDAISRF